MNMNIANPDYLRTSTDLGVLSSRPQPHFLEISLCDVRVIPPHTSLDPEEFFADLLLLRFGRYRFLAQKIQTRDEKLGKRRRGVLEDQEVRDLTEVYADIKFLWQMLKCLRNEKFAEKKPVLTNFDLVVHTYKNELEMDDFCLRIVEKQGVWRPSSSNEKKSLGQNNLIKTKTLCEIREYLTVFGSKRAKSRKYFWEVRAEGQILFRSKEIGWDPEFHRVSETSGSAPSQFGYSRRDHSGKDSRRNDLNQKIFESNESNSLKINMSGKNRISGHKGNSERNISLNLARFYNLEELEICLLEKKMFEKKLIRETIPIKNSKNFGKEKVKDYVFVEKKDLGSKPKKTVKSQKKDSPETKVLLAGSFEEKVSEWISTLEDISADLKRELSSRLNAGSLSFQFQFRLKKHNFESLQSSVPDSQGDLVGNLFCKKTCTHISEENRRQCVFCMREQSVPELMRGGSKLEALGIAESMVSREAQIESLFEHWFVNRGLADPRKFLVQLVRSEGLAPLSLDPRKLRQFFKLESEEIKQLVKERVPRNGRFKLDGC